MNHSWLFFVVLAGVSSIIFNVFNRRLLRTGTDSTVYAWLFEAIRALFFLSILPFDYFFRWSWFNALLLLALGLSEVAGVYLYMKMHSHNELSISIILQRLKVILVPAAAFIFLAERLTTTQYLGIVIVFLGCLTVALNSKVRGTKGLWYALGFIFANSASNLLIKATTGFASTSVVTTAFSLPAAVLIPVLMKSTKVRLPTARAILKPTLLASIFNVATMLAIVNAYRLAPAGIVSSTFQGLTTLSVLIGIVFLKERQHIAAKLIGATLTTIGIILLV